VAAGNAKINVIVDGLRQVQALEKSLNNISRLSGKINGVDNAPRVEQKVQKLKEAQRASMIRTRNIGDQIERLSAQGLNVDKARAAIKRASAADSAKELIRAKAYQDAAQNILRTEQEITKENKRQQQFRSIRGGSRGGGGGGIIRGNKFDNRSNSAALRSGLISGAFPLLFGQGLLGGAAGFAGGAIGTKMGGQMGGFAGGLVATAVLQGVTNLKDNLTELGSALDPATANVAESIEKLKIINTTRAAEIRLIEKTQGSQAALAEIQKDVAKVIGEDGVKELQRFSESMKGAGDEINKFLLKLKAGIAGLANDVADLFSGRAKDFNEALEALDKDDPLVKRFKDFQTREAEFFDRSTDPDAPALGSAFSTTAEGKKEGKLLENERKRLEFSIQMKAARESTLRLDKEMGVQYRDIVGSLEKQLETDRRILEIQKSGINPALATQLVAIEDAAKVRLDSQYDRLNTVNEEIKAEEALNKGVTDRLLFLRNERDGLLNNLNIIETTLDKEKDRIIANDEINKKIREQIATQKEIESILAGGMTNAVMGLIEGSKTLGQVLADVAKQLASMFLNKAFSSIFSNMFSGGVSGIGPVASGSAYAGMLGGAVGLYSSAGSFKAFRQGGIVTSPTMGIIGEGGESEYVIPASKMSGAMSRYSAGARGGAVIPGGSGDSGTVAGSSGNTVVEYTGPTLNFNGDEYVPKSAVPEIIGAATKQGAMAGKAQVLGTLKNSRSQRASLGL
jgi:hypothetical protein